MMQYCRLTTLSLLLIVLSLPAKAQQTCRAVTRAEVNLQSRQYGLDPAKVVKHATTVLHRQFQPRPQSPPNELFTNQGDIRLQMSVIFSYFSLSTWTEKLSQIPEVKNLSAVSSSELEYSFAHWMRSRYMSSVKAMIRDRELVRVFREPAYNKSTRDQVVKKPAELLVTGYEPFACESDWDQKSYKCDRQLIKVFNQLSPRTLCSQETLKRQGHFEFIVDVTSTPFKIVDVGYRSQRLYQDAFIDVSRMFNSGRDNLKVLRAIKLWSYRSPLPTPQKDLQAFQKAFKPYATRVPASKPATN